MEIWNRGTRPRTYNTSFSFPNSFLSFALFSFVRFSSLRVIRPLSPRIQAVTVATQVRDTEVSAEGHRKGEEWTRTDGFLSPSRLLLAVFLQRSPVHPFSPSRPCPIRCSKKSIRFSLPTRPVVFPFLETVVSVSLCCFLSRLQRDTLFASYCQEKSNQNMKAPSRGDKEGQDDQGGLNARGALGWGHRVSGTADRACMYSCLELLLLRDATRRFEDKHRSSRNSSSTRIYEPSMTCPENVTNRLV